MIHRRAAKNAEEMIFLQIGRCRSEEMAPPCRQLFRLLLCPKGCSVLFYALSAENKRYLFSVNSARMSEAHGR